MKKLSIFISFLLLTFCQLGYAQTEPTTGKVFSVEELRNALQSSDRAKWSEIVATESSTTATGVCRASSALRRAVARSAVSAATRATCACAAESATRSAARKGNSESADHGGDTNSASTVGDVSITSGSACTATATTDHGDVVLAFAIASVVTLRGRDGRRVACAASAVPVYG